MMPKYQIVLLTITGIALMGCAPQRPLTSEQVVYCVQAPPAGYVLSQDKWDPYLVPCPVVVPAVPPVSPDLPDPQPGPTPTPNPNPTPRRPTGVVTANTKETYAGINDREVVAGTDKTGVHIDRETGDISFDKFGK